MIVDVHPGSGSRDPDLDFLPIPDGSKIEEANPEPSSKSTSTFSHLTVFCVYLPAFFLL